MLIAATYLAGAIFNVTSYGAIGDGVTNDSQAFRDTFAAACLAGPGNSVYAPAATYMLPRINIQSAVYVEACDGIEFYGDGVGETILKMQGGSHGGDYYMLYFIISDDMVLRDFSCDGNRSEIIIADEQTHCIVETNCEDLLIHDVDLSHSYGDGIKLVGANETNTRITIRDITTTDNGRSGIATHSGSDILIERYTGSNIDQSCIDIEPGGGTGIDGFTLKDSTCVESRRGVTSMSFSGGTGEIGTPTSNVLIQNVVMYGCADSVQVDTITFDNVQFYCPSGDALHFGRDATNVTITRSAFSAEGGSAAISFSADDEANNITVSNVRLTVQDGVAFDIDGGAGNITLNNVRVFSQASFAQGVGVQTNTRTDTPDMENLVFDIDVKRLRGGVAILRRSQFLANVTSVELSGTITTRGGTDTFGISCANDAPLVLNDSEITISANTPVSGCP